MTLRTRLTIAFFAISVIPLSAVTLFSYFSSERALRRAAEQQASTLSAELGRRMEWVTTDLERRMDRVWPTPPQGEQMASAAPPPQAVRRRPSAAATPPASASVKPATTTDMAGHLAVVLGDVAPMIESLELMPMPPAPPAPGAVPPVPRPPSSAAAPGPAAAPSSSSAAATRGPSGFAPGKVVVEMSRVIDKAMEQYHQNGTASQADMAAWAKAMQERLRQVAADAKAGREAGSATAAKQPGAPSPAPGADAAPTPGSTEAVGAIPPKASHPGMTAPAPPPPSDPGGARENYKLQLEAARADVEAARREALTAFARGQRARANGASMKAEGDAARAAGANARPDAAPREQAAATAERLKAVTEMKGSDVNSSVRRDGHEVGRIHARLNMPRVIRTILPARREEGEVAFAIDSNGEIHASEADKKAVDTLKAEGAIPTSGDAAVSKADWVVVTRKGPAGMTFGTARPLGRDLNDLRAVAARNFGLGFGLITLVFFASVPLAGGMTRNLRTLMRGVQAVAHGDLSARVPVRSHDEFGRLAAAFNQMAAGLAEHEKLVVQQERLQRELELCRQIQNDMLPREGLRLGLAEVKGVSIPAREVGGDFFNYFVLPTGDIAVLVGDVSGKGVGAALLMANVQATLRARLPLEQDLARLADTLDRDLHANTPPEVYLTMFVGIVNPETRLLRYVNAGHNTQFVLHREAGIERMPSTGRPLGLLPGGSYEEQTAELPVGDVLFFYTDGIVEAENEAGEQFGMPRLEAALRDAAAPGSHVDEVLGRVEEAVRRFRGKAEPSDDATVMALKLGGESNE